MAAICAAVASTAAVSGAAASSASAAPYLKSAGFEYIGGEFGPYAFNYSVGNVSGLQANVRVCISHVCRDLGNSGSGSLTESLFGETWRSRQSRLVEIEACNTGGCMPKYTQEMVTSID